MAASINNRSGMGKDKITCGVTEVFEVLLRDQCGHGFEHTKDEIISWLRQCDDASKQQLRRAIDEGFPTEEEKLLRKIFEQ